MSPGHGAPGNTRKRQCSLEGCHNGGPGNTTEFVGLSLYRTGFEAFQMGEASALAIITLLIAIAFASIYLYVLSYRESRAQLQ